MEKTKAKKIFAIASSVVLATCMVGGVIAAGACSKDSEEKVIEKNFVEVTSSYTPERGNGTTYYVSPDAERYGGDGSYESPYNILDLVGNGTSGNHSTSSILKAGDTVLAIPGDYVLATSVYVEASGTYDNYVTIMNAAYANDGHGYETTSCTICLYGQSFDGNYRGVTINTDYIYWYGIDVAGAGDNGMYIGGNHNVIENCQFYNNRDTGLQLGRANTNATNITDWPSYNLIKNCTSFNNYDNETYGENADGFGAKLTIGYGNMFDGCIAYRNSDDGWDLYAKEDTGNIGCVIIYNCIAFENGYLLQTQEECNGRFPSFNTSLKEDNTTSYTTRDGDGNGFKLGGGSNEGDVKLYNCMSFNNRMHGVTDNSNPGTLQIDGVTSYINGASIDDKAPSTVVAATEGVKAIDDAMGNNNPGEETDEKSKDETEPASTFGQVKYDGGTEDSDCSNIDLSRWSYSYNTFANVLSVIDGNTKTAADAYRGAATNCMFASSSSTGYYVDGFADADSKNSGGIKGVQYSAASAADIFVETPALDLGVRETFNDNGAVILGQGNIHTELRLEDGTIYAGDMLKIKDDAKLVLKGVGANLCGKSWDDYEHYEYTCGQSSESAEADEIAAISNMIYIPVYEEAVYQNFKVVNSIWGVNITWTSSDSSVLRVTKNVSYTTSQSSAVDITVNRDPDKDKTVTLTASFGIEVEGEDGTTSTVDGEKSYELTVKKDTPSIGSIIVDGVEYGQAIVDQYSAFPEPAVTIENGADYNGKILDEGLYTIETTYEYAPTSADTFDEIGVFTTSNAGVYRITLDISINDPDEMAEVARTTYTYLIYVAGKDADVQFVGNPTLTVYRDGYTLSGEVSSPTGYSYIVKTDEPLTGTGEDGSVTPADILGNKDAIVEEFRTTTLTLDQAEDNDSEYYVYCVLTSLDGTRVSDVYEKAATVVRISDVTGFDSMLSSSNSSTIYLLTTDIDYNKAETGGSGTFKGLLNGLGHTVKNIKIESATKRAVFDTVDNGTIENIRFDSIEINYSGASSSGTSTSSGLIGLMKGGYLYNIAATDLTVISNGQRMGGIVGQINVSSGGNEADTYIQLVSLVNNYGEHGAYTTDKDGTHETYSGAIIKGSERVGGIVGFIQAGGTDSWNKVYITDCYVNAYITSTGGVAGGIVGRSDDRNANDYLLIYDCYTCGVLESTNSGKSYLGGMVGQFTGTGSTRIYNCMSLGEMWFGNESVNSSLKNASWIVGNFSANGDIIVYDCIALHEEYNAEYDVLADAFVLNRYTSMSRYITLDMKYWSYVFDTGSTDNGDGTYSQLSVPYVELVFQGEWETEN
ncbi:MAG: hypothetical protein LUD72_06100 [Bacteroidales bacterium]|nr:hypothetical protein [Bacteroidales bacterium]